MNKNFINCMKRYKAAVKSYDGSSSPTRTHVNDINAYFYILVQMRIVYGCPECWSKDRCGCAVMPPIHKAVRLSKEYPEIMW
jgi:hypothetical protein